MTMTTTKLAQVQVETSGITQEPNSRGKDSMELDHQAYSKYPSDAIMPTCAAVTTAILPNKDDTSQQEGEDDWKVISIIRLLYLSYYTAIGFVDPFLSMYYHSLGFGGKIVGILGSIVPFSTFLVAPIWGMISDRTGKPFLILYITTFLTLVLKMVPFVIYDYRIVVCAKCLSGIFSAPVKPLIDSLVLDQLHDRKQYGRLRLFSLLGTGIASSFAGRVLHLAETSSEESPAFLSYNESSSLVEFIASWLKLLNGYQLLFVIHAFLHILPFICIRYFQVMKNTTNQQRHQKQEEEMKKTTKSTTPTPATSKKALLSSIFGDVDSVVFFSTVFTMGVFAAVGDNFCYVRFREVGVTGTEIGLTRLTSSIAGALMFWYSGNIVSWLGSEWVFILGFVSVAARFHLYAKMDYIWYSHVAEGMRGMVYGCFWSTATMHASQMAPGAARATMLQFLNGMYNGIGRSAGSILGGKYQAEIGTSLVFSHGSKWNILAALSLMLYKYTKDTTFVNPLSVQKEAAKKDKVL